MIRRLVVILTITILAFTASACEDPNGLRDHGPAKTKVKKKR